MVEGLGEKQLRIVGEKYQGVLLTVAPPMARATLAPTPTKHLDTICRAYVDANPEPMLAAMAIRVKSYQAERPYS